MPKHPAPNAVPFIRQSLEHYAAFFASLVEGSEVLSKKELEEIQEIEQNALLSLNETDRSYYQERRSYLMRLFREQLLLQIEGQVSDDLVERVKSLESFVSKQ